MTEYLGILGAGGFAREAYHHAEDCGELPCLLADTPPNSGNYRYTSFGGLSTSQVIKKFVIGVGDPKIKAILVNKALKLGLQPVNCIHPSVVIGKYLLMGVGSIICPGVCITCNVEIGDYALINLNVTIGHDAKIGSFTTINPNCSISGNTTIGDRCTIGTGAVTREKSTIGDDIIVGANATVIKDLVTSGVYIGSPAKLLGTNS